VRSTPLSYICYAAVRLFLATNNILMPDFWYQVGKILLNALIYKGIKTTVQKNTVASIFHTSVSTTFSPCQICPVHISPNTTLIHAIFFPQDAQSSEPDGGKVVARPYLFRLKNEEAATNLSAVIKENVPTD
jgi:nuclear pore complex protein Nup50